ncbi:protein of unknown function [Cupriavidus taiwanensis]|nr:protein of unknown function [Cupriavidus taiwanensis]
MGFFVRVTDFPLCTMSATHFYAVA